MYFLRGDKIIKLEFFSINTDRFIFNNNNTIAHIDLRITKKIETVAPTLVAL